MKLKINSLEEMKKTAEDFAKTLNVGNVILLNGDLGAGKTTFTQFVLSYLGVKDQVTSPTFAILKTYEGKFTFHHFDTYRITTEEAIESGFDEVLSDKGAVIFIEWSENVAPLLPKETITINIKLIEDNKREIEILR